MSELYPRLLKIVALARDGVGGERLAAATKVQQICAREGLNFDDVMCATDKKEFALSVGWKNSGEKDIVAQACFKFAIPDGGDLGYNDYRKCFFYETTATRHIETVYAAEAYLAAYRKERRRILKDLPTAFIYKHGLFRPTGLKNNAEKAEPDYKALARQLNLTRNMDDVQIRKTLEAGKTKEEL